jgi:hypothetical protein
MSGIVAAIVGLAEAKRAKDEEEERRRRTYEEARARYEAQVRARNEERRQLRAVFRDASRLQRANRLREFIAAVEDQARHDGELTPEKTQWIEWARAKADWLDPFMRRSDPILHSIINEQSIALFYRRFHIARIKFTVRRAVENRYMAPIGTNRSRKIEGPRYAYSEAR